MEAAAAFDIVVMAGSLGGPEAARRVLVGVPPWFPAAVVLVQHRTAAAEQITVELLRRHTELPVELATEGARPLPGTVSVTPAARHLVLDASGAFAPPPLPVRRGYTADTVMRSVAERHGPRALGVVLSGMNDDGADGAVALKRAGGRVLAQDRATAHCFAMPAAAIATGCVDLVLPLERIADALISLIAWPGAPELLRVPLPSWARLHPIPPTVGVG